MGLRQEAAGMGGLEEGVGLGIVGVAPAIEAPSRVAPTPQRPLKVLIDAYNRDLEHGTGIATYSRILDDALHAQGHDTYWLYGRDSTLGAGAVDEEVTFHDPPVPMIRLLRRAQAIGRLIDGVTHSSSDAKRVACGVVSQARLGVDSSRIFNAPGLYRRAFFRHALKGREYEVRLPEKMDLAHLTSALPIRIRDTPTITTLHDVIPLRLPNTTADNKQKYLRLLRNSIASADLVFTVSDASKADIVNVLDVPEEKVFVTYQASDLEPLDQKEAVRLPNVLARHGLERGKYVLFVSAIEPKKNLRRLIDAFLEIDTDMPLVIVGEKAWMWRDEIGDLDEAFGAVARSRLRFLGYTQRDDLRFLYSGAMMLAFPSLYEGFGLPMLEAMRMKCPILTSDTAALREVAGDAAVFVDPLDRNDIRIQLERVMQDSALRKALVEKGNVRAQDFSMARYVERLSEGYARVI
jgi:glycosyltransferase involved in cell wall biosynthesis